MECADISFILPSYNVESYLKHCVSSIEDQKLINYEIIIIDDGSTDSTLKIAQELAEANAHIKVFHQENQGVSAARNCGLFNANGEYICFVDPDDFFIEKFADDFLSQCRRYDLDIIRGQYCNYYEDKGMSGGSAPFAKTGVVMTGKEYLIQCIRDRTLEVVPFLSIIKRSFLLKNKISFPEGIGYEEDQIHMLQCMMTDDSKVMQENLYFYAYRQRNSSVTHNVNPKQIRDIIKIIGMEQQLLHACNLDNKSNKILQRYISASFYQITALYAGLNKGDRERVYSEIPKEMIVHSIRYPIRKRFAVKGIMFLAAPELMCKLSKASL